MNNADEKVFRTDEFEMDYPYFPSEERLYDGQTHRVLPQKLVKITLPNGREAYILMYAEDNRIMLTFVEINGFNMVKVPLDNASYDQIDIQGLFNQGVDCSQLLSEMNRHIFCKPLTNYWNFLENEHSHDSETETIERVKTAAKEKPKIGVFVASESKWFLDSEFYNALFNENRRDISYLPLSQNTISFDGYNLLTSSQREWLIENYIIAKTIVNEIDVYVSYGNELLLSNLYCLIFNKPAPNGGYVQLSSEEINFLNKYYEKHYIFKKREIEPQNQNVPKCVRYDQVYYIRPDIAKEYNVEGLPVKLQFDDFEGNNFEGIYLDIPEDLLYSTYIIPDMNNAHETKDIDNLKIEGKRPQIFNVLRNQTGKSYVSLSKNVLERINLLPYAKKYSVVDGDYEDATWLLETNNEMEFVYKMLSKEIYPVFAKSSKLIEVKEYNGDDKVISIK